MGKSRKINPACKVLESQKQKVNELISKELLKAQKCDKVLLDDEVIQEIKSLSNWIFNLLENYIKAVERGKLENKSNEGYGVIIRCKPGKVPKHIPENFVQSLDIVPDKKVRGYRKFSINIDTSTQVIVFLTELIRDNSDLVMGYFKNYDREIENIYLFIYTQNWFPKKGTLEGEYSSVLFNIILWIKFKILLVKK